MNSSVYPFPYYSVRHISSPENQKNDCKVYVGQSPLSSILELKTDKNVRDYLPDGKKKPVKTQVHMAIYDTLDVNPDDFSVLNSGIVIVANDCHIDEKEKRLYLVSPSIINGSQTQGVIKDYLSDYGALPDCHIKFEIIITNDPDLIANISIARNFQNNVLAISIAGRRGHLDELEKSFQKAYPNKKLRKSETDMAYNDSEFVNTERLLQIIVALVPNSLSVNSNELNKVYAYSQKTRCLKEFDDIYINSRDDSKHELKHKYKDLYQFYLDISPIAFDIYEKWKSHQGFRGTGLHAIKRDDKGNISEIPDGIVFPILASLSVFAEKKLGKWTLDVPPIDSELIRAAKTSYIEVAKSNPNVMGKSKACYTTLLQVTTIVKRYRDPATLD